MATGDITCTNLGVVNVTGGAIKTLMDTQTTGAATAGADVATYTFTDVGNGQVLVLKIARAA